MAQGITCPSCNRTYAYKPALAGKRVKCKCGERIDFPAEELSLQDLGLGTTEGDSGAAGVEDFGGAAAVAEMPASAAVPEVAPPPLPTALCVNCRGPLAAGAVLCTRCGTNQRTGGVVRTQVLMAATEPVASQPQQSSGSGEGTANMLIGGVMVAVGLVITIGSYSAASGGGMYLVFWGPVVYGAIRFFRGVGQAISGD